MTEFYHGISNGVGSLSLGPTASSTVPMSLQIWSANVKTQQILLFKANVGIYFTYPGPRGAQNVPVDLIVKVLMNSINFSAATSGVTAVEVSAFLKPTQQLRKLTSSLIPHLVKAVALCQFCTHEARTIGYVSME